MTLGGSCYFYTHFGEANSILMSNPYVMLTIPYIIKDVFDERRRITRLTQFNLLTLGIAQASLALRSFNRKFQHLSAVRL